MARSTMTINIRFSPRVEPFCGEDSLTVFSNVVPEREKKRKIFIQLFSERLRLRLIEPKEVPMDTNEKKRFRKIR